MLQALREIREALEYIQDGTPNFNIEHKAKQALSKLDAVMEKQEEMQKTLPEIKKRLSDAEYAIGSDNVNGLDEENYRTLISILEKWENE